MPASTVVHIVNFSKRKVISKSFSKICEAIAFMKSYTRGKDCFIYAERYDEVLAIKNDLSPMKVYDRSSDYEESYELDLHDNHKLFFNFTITPSLFRFGYIPPNPFGLF